MWAVTPESVRKGRPKDEVGSTVPPGGTVEQCTVHLAADGDEPFAVGFEDADEGDLTGWRADVS